MYIVATFKIGICILDVDALISRYSYPRIWEETGRKKTPRHEEDMQSSIKTLSWNLSYNFPSLQSAVRRWPAVPSFVITKTKPLRFLASFIFAVGLLPR